MKTLTQLNEINMFSDLGEERVFKELSIPISFSGVGNENFECHYPKQVHGLSIVEASSATAASSSQRPQADAIYTHDPSLTIGVQTADCLPILLVNEKKTTVMALHAGWRGLTAGVVKRGVQTLKGMHAKDKLYACIGPSIAHCHYEVGPDVVDALQGEALGLRDVELAFSLTKGSRDRHFLDLATVGIFALLNAGLESRHISVFRSCTFCSSKKWHSFRRDASASLRNWSSICIPSV